MKKATFALLSIITVCWLCSLCAADDIPVQENLEIKRLDGKWYPIASVKREFMPRSFYAFTIESSEDGDVNLKVEVPRFGRCKVKKVPLHMEKPGVFSMEDGLVTIRIVETDYDTYFISHFTSGTIIFLNLYGREKEVQEKVKQKFMAVVEKLQFNPERIFFRHEMDLCTEPAAGS